MELRDAIINRKTTNTAFAPEKISRRAQRASCKMASHCPSHLIHNTWRFILVDDEDLINKVTKIAGDSMVSLMDDSRFWKQYRKYFRSAGREMGSSARDGIHIDHLPSF